MHYGWQKIHEACGEKMKRVYIVKRDPKKPAGTRPTTWPIGWICVKCRQVELEEDRL